MFCIGVDIAKHKHETSVIRSDRKPLCESVSLFNTQKGREKLIALMQTLTITAGNRIIGMEGKQQVIIGCLYIPICLSNVSC